MKKQKEILKKLIMVCGIASSAAVFCSCGGVKQNNTEVAKPDFQHLNQESSTSTSVQEESEPENSEPEESESEVSEPEGSEPENSEAETQSVTEVPPSAEPDDVITESWRTMYADVLAGYPQDADTMYDLCDVDGDSIPELFISEGISDESATVGYTVYNGSISELGRSGCRGETIFCKEENVILSNTIVNNSVYNSILVIENGKFKALAKSEYGESETEYFINDQPANETEFWTVAASYEPLSDKNVGRKYSMSENIMNVSW